jgi:4,5-DOPA dioxygenase extradiol
MLPTMPARHPVLFIGHGSPMNAIQENAFTRVLVGLGRELPRPRAVLCVSAHWMTEGTWITRMAWPRTIHDFYGFPPELFQVQYPAPGSPEIADQIAAAVPGIHPDEESWGLDHGSWAVLRHVFPAADIPVLQLSLHLQQPAEYHLELGRRLRPLRDQGILIVGSGNVVHNLRRIRWEEDAEPYPWAREFDERVKERISGRDHAALLRTDEDEVARLSVPTAEHYLPLLYVLGASSDDDALRFHFEEIHNASISMRTWTLGAS